MTGPVPAARCPFPLRTHQRLALSALETLGPTGRRRGWVVLPPGAGKTLVGLEQVRRLAAAGEIDAAVAFGPNTAIQGQWARGWGDFWPEPPPPASGAGTDRSLSTFFTALTYQSLASFDREADEESDREPETDDAEESLLGRLHPHGRALVRRMAAAGRIAIVLDECHHLLEVWGELLREVLDELGDAYVIGLTATPPGTMTPRQRDLVADLFGSTLFECSIPAVVKQGDLAPFGEQLWLTRPTAAETTWLAEQGERFLELTTALTDPSFGTVSFLTWLDRRFVSPVGRALDWPHLVRDEPELTDAALRMHHAGLMARPAGAVPTEATRRDPTTQDWMALVSDWLQGHVRGSDDPADERVVQAVRRALPAVGYQWTRRGIRRGRSPVDRVLARSAAKPRATVQIVTQEWHNLGARLRMLVLCDHESATATPSARLREVLSADAGSARLVLRTLAADETTGDLGPLLVSARTVAGAPQTLRRLVDHVAGTDPGLADRLVVGAPEDGVSRLTGPWGSRTWVPLVTRFFEDGGSQVLVGTRALLGEGWDAQRVTGLVDLTAATTATAVTQTRGRALRTDPSWPQKVALNWSVVCVAPEHPRGDQDWDRLVRKHTGFYGVDQDGEVIDGVAHIDAELSPYAPPPAERFDALNARMLAGSQDRAALAERWQVGAPYVDTAVATVRILPARAPTPTPLRPEPRNPAAIDLRRPPRRRVALPVVLAVWVVFAVLTALLVPWPVLAGCVALDLAGPALIGFLAARAGAARERILGTPPTIAEVAAAVADGLHATDLSPVGAEAVRLLVDRDGEYRCALDGVEPEVSQRFAESLAEAVAPIGEPRYLLPRWTLTPGGTLRQMAHGIGRLRPDGEVWHAVPSVLGVRAARAQAYARAWNRWVGGGEPVYTRNPEGAGILAATRGTDPFAVTSVLRTAWR